MYILYSFFPQLWTCVNNLRNLKQFLLSILNIKYFKSLKYLFETKYKYLLQNSTFCKVIFLVCCRSCMLFAYCSTKVFAQTVICGQIVELFHLKLMLCLDVMPQMENIFNIFSNFWKKLKMLCINLQNVLSKSKSVKFYWF